MKKVTGHVKLREEPGHVNAFKLVLKNGNYQYILKKKENVSLKFNDAQKLKITLL